ncbi:hypothetical protein CD790_28020 [Streptomyces sp. SAJ15]|nr:hypothetical protein CD790_28020 [Streptomyces sp. SAJ15]
MAYEPYIQLKFPPPYTSPNTGRVRVGFLAAQWDAAKYLNNSGGGGSAKKKGSVAFPVSTYLVYSSKPRAPEKAVADHIKLAYNRPGKTKPVNQSKKVPGFDNDHKLHRLYHDTKRRKANRDAAIAVCEQYWGKGYPQGKKYQCDECPFAVTYEGSAQAKYDKKAKKKNFSAMPLAARDNEKAGSILAQFLTKNRVLDGRIGDEEIDSFKVWID